MTEKSLKNYLYGASIQGIQNYIFETNKLSEMVGASEIVEQLSRSNGFWKNFLDDISVIIEEKNWMRDAAGNVRFICEKKEDLEKIVRYFPMKAQEKAPGMMVSQAVIEYSDHLSQEEHLDVLEEKLKIQRNKPLRPAQVGLTAMACAPRTGKPAYKRDDDGLVDFENTKKQNNKSSRLVEKLLDNGKTSLNIENKIFEFTLDMEKLSRPHDSWIAVIHADGNGIGRLLQELGQNLEKNNKIVEGNLKFSKSLDNATTEAAKQAFQETVVQRIKDKKIEVKQDKDKNTFLFPIRPIVLGGDDITIICRADLAIDFTVEFLKQFKIQTKEKLKFLKEEYNLNEFQEGLTACAGIAFIKDKYPFHYGYALAEGLCKEAKNKSKKIDNRNIPSSLAFHKVQSSFYEDYQKTLKQELTIFYSKEDEKSDKIFLNFGPYAIDEISELPNIQALCECVNMFKEKNALKSGLRRWLSELWENRDSADQILKRLVQITTEKNQYLLTNFNQQMNTIGNGLSLNTLVNKNKTPIYDILTLASLSGKE